MTSEKQDNTSKTTKQRHATRQEYQVEGGLTVKEVIDTGKTPEPVTGRRCACGQPLRSRQKMCDYCWNERRLLRRAEKAEKRQKGKIWVLSAKKVRL